MLYALASLLLFAPAPEAKPVLYYPTKIGDKLVYEFTDRDKRIEFTETVLSAEKKDGVITVTISRKDAPADQPARKVKVSETGLALLANDPKDLQTPPVLLKLPSEAGDMWKSKPENAGLGTITGCSSTFVGIEEVKVPAGQYKAIRVDSVISLSGEQFKASHWYAPGVGLVKMVARGRIQELKSFTPGK